MKEKTIDFLLEEADPSIVLKINRKYLHCLPGRKKRIAGKNIASAQRPDRYSGFCSCSTIHHVIGNVFLKFKLYSALFMC